MGGMNGGGGALLSLRVLEELGWEKAGDMSVRFVSG